MHAKCTQGFSEEHRLELFENLLMISPSAAMELARDKARQHDFAWLETIVDSSFLEGKKPFSGKCFLPDISSRFNVISEAITNGFENDGNRRSCDFDQDTMGDVFCRWVEALSVFHTNLSSSESQYSSAYRNSASLLFICAVAIGRTDIMKSMVDDFGPTIICNEMSPDIFGSSAASWLTKVTPAAMAVWANQPHALAWLRDNGAASMAHAARRKIDGENSIKISLLSFAFDDDPSQEMIGQCLQYLQSKPDGLSSNDYIEVRDKANLAMEELHSDSDMHQKSSFMINHLIESGLLQSPLICDDCFISAISNGCVDVVEHLAGFIDCNQVMPGDTYGTFLHCFACADDIQQSQGGRIADILINKTDDIDMINIAGYTALHFAVLHGNAYAVQLLLSAGANHTLETPYGGNAMTLALDSDNPEFAAAINAFLAKKSMESIVKRSHALA